jgi:transposase-like protein
MKAPLDMKCPNCAREMILEEKDTSSGRDMRTYRCGHCGRSEDVDNGIALWQVLSDARETEEARSRSQRSQAEALSGRRWKISQWLKALQRRIAEHGE